MHSDLRCASRSAHARGTPVHKQRQSEGGRRQRPSEAIRGHQKQSEAIRERSAAVNGQPQPIENRSKAIIRVHQRQSGVISGHQGPSETVRRRSSGFISGHQWSSVVIRVHRKPFEGDHQGSSVVIRGHRKPFEGHQWAIIIRAIIISVPALGGPRALHEGPPPPPMMTPSAAPRRPAATRELIRVQQWRISDHQ